MTAKDTIYLTVRAGFANRLRALISGICLAEDLGKKLVVIWDLEPSCGISANIFEKTFPSFVTFQNLPTDNFHFVKTINDIINKDEIKIVSYYEFHTSDPKRWTAHLQNVKFKIQSPICNTIGVHIRRTDHDGCIRLSPLDYFIKAMKKESKEAIFYLATDCEKTKAIMLDIFGSRIITNNFVLQRNTQIGMQNALYDFISLSQCTKIIGSNGSSFSELAARYGSIELITNLHIS